MYDELRAFADSSYGITADEFNEISDHRPIQVMMDAMNYRKAKQIAIKKQTQPPKSTKRSSASDLKQTVNARAAKADHDRLRKSGRTSDAAPILERQIAKLLGMN